MSKPHTIWKKGHGKLGVLTPLLGTWSVETDSPRGPLQCTRSFTRVLAGAYIQLATRWVFGDGVHVYEEQALYGLGDDDHVMFWSFTSDGKRAVGVRADVSDIHLEAIGFVSEMPGGQARMAYWPGDQGTLNWATESYTQDGWRRFVEHHYRAVK